MANESVQKNRRESSRARGKFFFLFVFLLIDLALYPYATHQDTPSLWFRLLNVLVAISCVYAVSFRRWTWIIALVLAVPVALHHSFAYEIAASKLGLASAGITIVFDIFIIVVIFKKAFQTREVSADAIFAAVSIYLLLGFAFANVYYILVTLQHGAFYLDPALNHHTTPVRFDLIYYSFVTMTSLGAAGISPVSDQARSLSIIESVVGILYLGVLVSRLIAIYKPQGDSETQP
jgi:Ion channel